jgi:hypothetical protein
MLLKKPASWYLFSMIAGLGLLFACKKDKSVDNGGYPTNAPVLVTTSLQGRILNENQEPVQGAFVYTGAHSTTTDVNGGFLLENVFTDANATTVHIEKNGYFNGSRTIVASNKKLQFVQVELLPKKTGASFTNATGGTVQLQNCKLQFAANQALKENNTAYSGSVQVAYAYLNPESSNFTSIMPGDLRGIDASGKEVGLESFGMIAVELLGAGGEKLHLDSTKAATLTLTIPASQLGTAPASIPLWYFQEETGLWKEEGVAVKQGGAYVGTVKHFSFWNCDAPFPLVDFKAVFQDQLGAALGNVQVQVKAKSGTAQASAYVAADGTISGKIPANMALEMKVLSGLCRTELYKADIGPYAQNADLGTLTITVPVQNQLTLKGAVTNCTGTNVTDGFVTVAVDGINYRTAIEAGKYAITIARCNNNAATATIAAYDAATSKYNNSSLSVTSGALTFNLTACDNTASQFINLTINNQLVQYMMPADTITTSQTVDRVTVYASRRNAPLQNFTFSFIKINVPAFTKCTQFRYTTPSNKTYIMAPNDNVPVSITKVDNITLEGTVQASITDSTVGGGTSQVPLSLTFKVLNR